LRKIGKYGKLLLSLLNPWAVDDPDDEPNVFEWKPHPEKVDQIRRSARMMNRMAAQQQEQQP
jgi:hypothetical protein